jgi:hypothetical protein
VIAALHDTLKTTTAALSEEHSIEIAAIWDQLNTGIVALREKLNTTLSEERNTVIQENERFKSAKSLAGPELAKIETAQAKHDMISNLMMTRKKLEGAGFSASEIDEQLPPPRKDENKPSKKKRLGVVLHKPSKKRRRGVVKKEEET